MIRYLGDLTNRPKLYLLGLCIPEAQLLQDMVTNLRLRGLDVGAGSVLNAPVTTLPTPVIQLWFVHVWKL